MEGVTARPDTELRIDPFVGWKTLNIVSTSDDGLGLVGHGNHPYGVDAVAACGRGHSHAVPDWYCSCGFYALEERPTRSDHGWCIANVELFGTVIEGERGWRASRQRVLSLEVFKTCYACREAATAIAFAPDGKAVPVCASHGRQERFQPSDLTRRLGTEVRWGPALEAGEAVGFFVPPLYMVSSYVPYYRAGAVSAAMVRMSASLANFGTTLQEASQNLASLNKVLTEASVDQDF